MFQASAVPRGARVILDFERKQARIGRTIVPVEEAGHDGGLRVGGADGPWLRPLKFGERSRVVARAGSSGDALAAVARATLRAGLVEAGSLAIEPVVLEVLALYLAGADADDAPPFVEVLVSVARATGWAPDKLAELPAIEADGIACQLQAAQDDHQQSILFLGAPSDDLGRVRDSLARELIRRAHGVSVEPAPIRETNAPGSAQAAASSELAVSRSSVRSPAPLATDAGSAAARIPAAAGIPAAAPARSTAEPPSTSPAPEASRSRDVLASEAAAPRVIPGRPPRVDDTPARAVPLRLRSVSARAEAPRGRPERAGTGSTNRAAATAIRGVRTDLGAPPATTPAIALSGGRHGVEGVVRGVRSAAAPAVSLWSFAAPAPQRAAELPFERARQTERLLAPERARPAPELGSLRAEVESFAVLQRATPLAGSTLDASGAPAATHPVAATPVSKAPRPIQPIDLAEELGRLLDEYADLRGLEP